VQNNTLIFICAALRSGSTLLRLMLDQHPRIKNPGEFDFMFDLVKDDGSFPETQNYHQFLKTNRIFQSKNLVIDFTLNSRKLISSFVKQLNQQNCALSFNVHRNFHRIPFVFPDAKYIHLLLDPRDVAKSCIGMGWAGNVYYGVDSWLETEASWNKLFANIQAEQAITVFYEDLIGSPGETLKHICRFIDIPYSPEMLSYDSNSTYGKPDRSLIGQWQNNHSQREVQYIESKASQLMLSRGYCFSGHPLMQIGPIENLKLGFQNKWSTWIHGLTRYGGGLFLQEKIARKLKLEKLHQQCIN
jgi:hypothetical protein